LSRTRFKWRDLEHSQSNTIGIDRAAGAEFYRRRAEEVRAKVLACLPPSRRERSWRRVLLDLLSDPLELSAKLRRQPGGDPTDAFQPRLKLFDAAMMLRGPMR
jgi:hypothetical protein